MKVAPFCSLSLLLEASVESSNAILGEKKKNERKKVREAVGSDFSIAGMWSDWLFIPSSIPKNLEEDVDPDTLP